VTLPRRLATLCLLLAGALLIGACTEDLDTRDNCPALCPDQFLTVRDTTFDAVVFDSTFGGFVNEEARWPSPAVPNLGAVAADLYATYVPLTVRGDSLDIRQVYRFDTIPRTVSGTDTAAITAFVSPELRLRVGRDVSSVPRGGFTAELYDLDSTGTAADTVSSRLVGLFRPDRRITSVIVDSAWVANSNDTLRLNLPPSFMLAKSQARGRVRIGVRLIGPASTALQVVASRVPLASLVPQLRFRVNTDTADRVILPYGTIDSLPTLRLASQTLTVRGEAPALADGSIEVGGLDGWRSLLRVTVPRRFLDSVEVVRITLDLVQRPQRSVPGAGDSILLRPRVVVAGDSIRSARLRSELLDPILEAVLLRTVRAAPRDSGVRSFDISNALRAWSDSLRPTELVMYSESEGSREQRIAFYSRRNANPALRPRIRITYIPRQRVLLP
jgi:hypothetical protein